MERGNENTSSIFDNCHVSASQEEFLQRCGYALQDTPPDSGPVVGVSPHGVTSQGAPDDDSLIGSPYDPVESEPVRFLSPPQSVDAEEEETDRTVPVESAVEAEDRGGKRLESRVKEDGGKKLEIPLRDIVKAIVMNSGKTEEPEETEKMSFVQLLIQKGIKFP